MSYLCYDVGGTFIKYAVFDELGNFLKKAKYPTNALDPTAFFKQMAMIANDEPDVQAIGISFPGFINTETGEAYRAGALGQLDGLNLIDQFKQQLKRDIPVAIENDANCAALAEKLSGNAQDVHDFAVITIGTGIGGGIVMNDKVLHGKQFRAGEFGMMITDYTAHHVATLHDLAATSSLITRYTETKMLDPDQVTGEQIMAEFGEDEQTTTIVNAWADYVAIAIFNLSVTNAPQRILLGGGISQNPKLLAIVKAALKRIPAWTDFECEVVICQYHNDSGLIGALYLAKQIAKEG
ncbi:ROK family protein [Lapidilactobacillus mulanensis]|uniref:ROK family protein n=1 Tax=Lapidilactobacillus mulanensis TaxID=2485999 RepID=A0ABW4DRL8_9LACO|nr:ROK family protein [Lapidilactobacillus mulanensis]